MDHTHWTDITGDPNSAEALAYRRRTLRRAHRSPVRSRNEHFATVAEGKRVLDVGCVDHLAAGVAIAPLHRRLAESAREIVGVDIAETGLKELQGAGYNVELADITKPGLIDVVGSGFDVITAGEVIEHLLDVSTFFENVRQVLAPGGILILSTPNPHALHLVYGQLTGRPKDSADHVTYHWPSGMAEIADRTDFELLEIRGERRLFRRSPLAFLFGLAISSVWRTANAECITLMYTLRPRSRQVNGTASA